MTEDTPKRNHLKWLLPILILILAVVATVLIVKSRKPPEKLAHMNRGILVETMEIEKTSQRAMVHATGTVEPQQEITLVAEVSGTITWASPRFVEGGFFRKGEKLLEIDPRDYRLAVQRAQADLARARIGLQTEEEQSNIAQREWQRLELPDKGEPSPLVLRTPQLAGEKANLAAAKAGQEQAELNLKRTVIRAPYSGRLRSKKVDLGEYIRTGNPLGNFAGTDRADIIVPLPVEDLRWLDIPRAGSAEKGSACSVTAQIGSMEYQWDGYVARAFGEIDSQTRMARIAISVEDPYNLKSKVPGQKTPLANGLFVKLEISGSLFEGVVNIPRSALREGDSLYLVDDENKLEIRPVHVLRRQGANLLIDKGLNGGERLIITNLSGAADGMKLRPQAREPKS